jgi:hypothetical protein
MMLESLFKDIRALILFCLVYRGLDIAYKDCEGSQIKQFVFEDV